MKKIYLGGPVNKVAERVVYHAGARRRIFSFANAGRVRNFLTKQDYLAPPPARSRPSETEREAARLSLDVMYGKGAVAKKRHPGRRGPRYGYVSWDDHLRSLNQEFDEAKRKLHKLLGVGVAGRRLEAARAALSETRARRNQTRRQAQSAQRMAAAAVKKLKKLGTAGARALKELKESGALP